VAERATVFETIQLGVEATSGTAVPANKLLQSLFMQSAVDLSIDMFRPEGNKFPTVAAAGKDLYSGRVIGKPTYTEIVYPLSSLLGAATITGPNADGAYTWVFNPSSTAADAFKTFTIQQGSGVRAMQWAYGLFSNLGLTGDRQSVDLDGTMMGQAISDGITLTATPTTLTLVPVLPKQVDCFVDTTSAGLGTTRLGRLLKYRLGFGDEKYNPLWTVDSTQSSFAAVVEKAPGAALNALVEADANGMALLTDARAGNTKFVRLQCSGPLIAGASSYSIKFDFATKLGKPDPFQDHDAVYAIGWNMPLVHDGTWGKALTVTVMTTLASL